MEYRIINDNEKDRFDDFIAAFEWGDLMQSVEWGVLKSKGGWKPVSVIAEENGEIKAAATLLARPIPKTKRCIMYAPRGPVMDTKNRDLVLGFTDFIRKVAKDRGAILVKIDPPVPVEDVESDKNIRDAGFTHLSAQGFGGTQPKCVMQLDLKDKTPDELLASFKEKWRYNIRLAGRKGVTVNMDCTRDDLPVFYNILKETCARDGFMVRSLTYFEDMWDALAPKGWIKLILTYYEGKAVAGAVAYLFGDKAMYTYGASSNEYRNVMPNHLMQWNMIQWAKENDCKWYDFRGVSPKSESGELDAHLAGLNRFKEGFRPRFVEYIGEYDLILSPLWYKLWVVAVPKVRAFLKRRGRK